MAGIKYYAITKYDTTKENPFAVIRLREGIFEKYKDGKWAQTDRYDDILIGEFIDYEVITEEEARRIIGRK